MINDHGCHKASTSKKSHKFPYNFIRSLLTRLNYLVVRAHLADTSISQWGVSEQVHMVWDLRLVRRVLSRFTLDRSRLSILATVLVKDNLVFKLVFKMSF